MGVFDGHGCLGENAAQVCASFLPLLLLNKLRSGSNVEQAMVGWMI